jgi:hypothetical protein
VHVHDIVADAVAAAGREGSQMCFIFGTAASAVRIRNAAVAFRPLSRRRTCPLVAAGWACSIIEVMDLIVEAVLSLDGAAQQTGQPVRRLRQWCATGRIRCERDRRGWLVPEVELARIRSIAAARTGRGSDRSARALVVPRFTLGSANLQGQVAQGLRIPATTVALDALTIDGQPYVIATWPSAADARGSALADLAEELDGELLD